MNKRKVPFDYMAVALDNAITVAAVIFGPICTLFSDDFEQFSPIFGHLCGRNNNKCWCSLAGTKHRCPKIRATSFFQKVLLTLI